MSELPVSRRTLMAGVLAVATAAAERDAAAAPVGAGTTDLMLGGRPLHVLDLTHALTAAFNVTPLRPRIAMDPIVGSGLKSGMNLNRLMLVEHTGTHIDAPRHFANEGASLGEIPVADLVVPLAVVDLRERARTDPDAGLTREDVLAWEKRHGRLPDGCCVAINGGYDPVPRMREMMAGGRRGSPGFTPEGARFLAEQRSVKGIAVDAMSIDQGRNGPAYPVHQQWLRSGRWGIEGMANLEAVPASGAILIVGAAPVADATGMPIRALALVAGSG